MEPMHLVRESAVSEFPQRAPPAGRDDDCQPQLPRHHDGHSVAHGLRLLHVVCGDDGPSLAVLEGGAEGSPAWTHRQRPGEGGPSGGQPGGCRWKLEAHHMRCLDLGSIPDDGSSSRMICGFPIMLSAKHSCKRWQTSTPK